MKKVLMIVIHHDSNNNNVIVLINSIVIHNSIIYTQNITLVLIKMLLYIFVVILDFKFSALGRTPHVEDHFNVSCKHLF